MCLPLASTAWAQEAPASTAPTTASPASAAGTASENHERILGIIPAFNVTNLRRAPTLTPREKLKLFARQAFDPFQWVAAGAQAGFSQAQNNMAGYGQGAAGYGKRYGAAMADVTDHEFISNFLFPVIWKQDPRYFRLGQGSIRHRVVYSFAQEFSAHSDTGEREFNASKVLGAFAAKAVSNAYYPRGDRGFDLTLSRSVLSLGTGMLSGLGAEFWPDIDCRLFHRCANK